MAPPLLVFCSASIALALSLRPCRPTDQRRQKRGITLSSRPRRAGTAARSAGRQEPSLGSRRWLASKFSLWTRMEDPCGNDLAPLSCGAFFARGVPGAQSRSPGVVTPSKAARPPAAGRGYSRLCEPGQLLSTRGAENIPRPCAQATMTTLFNWTDVRAPAPSLAIPYLNWT